MLFDMVVIDSVPLFIAFFKAVCLKAVISTEQVP
jgi:hypothetical protein